MARQAIGVGVQRSAAGEEPWPAHPVLLGIAGDSAAGRSTLAQGLVGALGPDRATTLCLDHYHRFERTERRSLPFSVLHPNANYVDIANQHVELLAEGHPVLRPTYDHRGGTLGRPVVTEPRAFVVVEGLLALASKRARACYDASVYLDPPEPLRRRRKIARDTAERGYADKAAVLEELDRREPDAVAFVRPQRVRADIVVRFAPLPERGEGLDHPLSATVLLRPTIPQPKLHGILTPEHREAMELTLARDEGGKPAEVLCVYASAPPALARELEAAIWAELGGTEAVPESLGALGSGERSEPLALVQLLLLYHLFHARQNP